MTQHLDPLARLRADRDANLHAVAIDAWVSANRRQHARDIGYRLALNHLTWQQVGALRRALESMRMFGDGWFSRMGGLGLATILGDVLPEDPDPRNFAEWVAFLEGVEDAAVAVEAAG